MDNSTTTDASAAAALDAPIAAQAAQAAPYVIIISLVQIMLDFVILAFALDVIGLYCLDVICSSTLSVCMICFTAACMIMFYHLLIRIKSYGHLLIFSTGICISY